MQINGKRNGKGEATPSHGGESQVEPLVIVEADRVTNKGAVMIKEQDTTTCITAVFRPKRSQNMTSMT